MVTKAVPTREYKTFPRAMDATPLARHGRDTEATRERIARPVDATPRRAQDWR